MNRLIRSKNMVMPKLLILENIGQNSKQNEIIYQNNLFNNEIIYNLII